VSTVTLLNNDATQGSTAGVYGGLYLYQGNTPQTIVPGASPVQFTCWNSANGAVSQYNNIVPSKINNNLILNTPGNYQLNWSLSFYTNLNTIHLEVYAFANGSALKNTGAKQMNSTSNQIVNMSGGGPINVNSSNTVIDLRGFHDNVSSANITITNATLNVTRIG